MKKNSSPAKRPKPRSSGEETLALQLRAGGVKGWEREVRFHPVRRFRFDFAFPDAMLAVEVMGGVHWSRDGTRGAHVTPFGYEKDCEKMCLAATLGWRVLHVTSTHVRNGKALGWILECLSRR